MGKVQAAGLRPAGELTPAEREELCSLVEKKHMSPAQAAAALHISLDDTDPALDADLHAASAQCFAHWVAYGATAGKNKNTAGVNMAREMMRALDRDRFSPKAEDTGGRVIVNLNVARPDAVEVVLQQVKADRALEAAHG